MTAIAVIRIRGNCKVRSTIEDTMNMLRLNKVNYCVILPKTKNFENMVKKAKDYTTWGEIDEQTLVELLKKRGRVVGNKKLTEEFLKNTDVKSFEDLAKKLVNEEILLKNVKDVKPLFRLHGPRKGHNRQGVKKPVAIGGALGYRGKDINDLIKKMM